MNHSKKSVLKDIGLVPLMHCEGMLLALGGCLQERISNNSYTNLHDKHSISVSYILFFWTSVCYVHPNSTLNGRLKTHLVFLISFLLPCPPAFNIISELGCGFCPKLILHTLLNHRILSTVWVVSE